ncbi:MAG: QacE family quaternary ammonium compound efflux SMR transporter [Gammaproteobacteria bacterium HGW-Gammaproteobacteria-1]|jgi:quaternary ammonium compound-resistance protein SugE|nr:MAG: QacE family quaternary ammonium compound efflux SMR transporter [Gammaproteobacteria bacterium HGW-Gammaproteobacteria-1]
MGWNYLLLAGLFELGFTTSLKLSDQFTRLGPTLLTLLFGGISFWLLSKAMQSIPLGTAYAVWTGIGAFGTAIIGMLFFKDPLTFWRAFFLCTLIGSIAGLKFIAHE